MRTTKCMFSEGLRRGELTRRLTLALLVLTGFIVKGSWAADKSNLRFFEVRISDSVIAAEFIATHKFALGHWRIYDRHGRQVGEIGATDAKTFCDGLNAVLQSPSPVASDKTLEWEMTRLVDRKRNPLRNLPDADFTIVKYWTSACKDCQTTDRAEKKLLQQVLASHNSLTVNVLHAEEDARWTERK